VDELAELPLLFEDPLLKFCWLILGAEVGEVGERQMKYRVMIRARITAIATTRVYLRRGEGEGKGGLTELPGLDGVGTAGCGTVCCCESGYCAVPCTPGILEL